MPRFPGTSITAAALPGSIFTRLVAKLPADGEVFPFHLGDTHLAPAARCEELGWDEAVAGDLYRYAAPSGDPGLIDALVEKLRAANRLAVEPANLQVTAGATHAFACAFRVLLDEGDEVLLLAPFWPLIRGQVLALGARPVEVPFYDRLYANPAADVAALIRPHLTSRTAAIYVTTPNNPDGKVLDERALAGVAQVAREADLWVFADEVYEHFAYDGRAHVSIASLPGLAERTVTAYSFSKSYAQAGLRVGYAVAPALLQTAMRTLALHTIYNVPRAMQRVARAALEGGGGFLDDARREYAALREAAAALLPGARLPEGGSYLFVDLRPHLRPGEPGIELMERLAAVGVLLAPGSAFGNDYADFGRLCYTAVSRSRLERGVARMADVLTSG